MPDRKARLSRAFGQPPTRSQDRDGAYEDICASEGEVIWRIRSDRAIAPRPLLVEPRRDEADQNHRCKEAKHRGHDQRRTVAV